MNSILFQIFILISFGLFIIPKKYLYYFSFFLHIAIISITSFWAINCFTSNISLLKIDFIPFMGNWLKIEIDKLSAFFILVINLTVLGGIIYAKEYLKPYFNTKNRIELSFHFFNFLWLHISMLLITMFRDALSFIIIWEIMSLSSFFLVIFDSEKENTIKIGIKYLIQMHIGVIFIILGFMISYIGTGADLNFDSLSEYFSQYDPFLLFLIFFIGFGIKAGFIPLHSWLPHAHPAAPSHVSGVMSGVMIKMGIYGILRIITYLDHNVFYIGLFILIISIISGLLGVKMAIVQHDIKKLLAYHSIENIGIIGMGIGLGLIGIDKEIHALAVLGFAGAILHILNHSLFKSLLFYSAGSVYQKTKTLNIENMGGLIKKMPKTALFFLLGAVAICGLPPLNGFISEFLLYSGIFKSMFSGDLMSNILLLFSFVALVIIGGLAIFCFTKAFSIIFLGFPRNIDISKIDDSKGSMVISYIIISLIIILIGFFPLLFMNIIAQVVNVFTKDISYIYQVNTSLYNISLSGGIFVILIIAIWILRNLNNKNKKIKKDITWGCGYVGANPSLHQYTATSYGDNMSLLAKNIVNIKKDYIPYLKNEIFPSEKTFKTHSSDIFEDNLIIKPSNKIIDIFQKLAVFQTGKIQHYLLYALVFMIVIFILSLLNLI